MRLLTTTEESLVLIAVFFHRQLEYLTRKELGRIECVQICRQDSSEGAVVMYDEVEEYLFPINYSDSRTKLSDLFEALAPQSRASTHLKLANKLFESLLTSTGFEKKLTKNEESSSYFPNWEIISEWRKKEE